MRIKALGGHTSRLNPLFYGASLAVGAVAGKLGDRWNLGFLAETEQQVVEHLETHLEQLPEHDHKSRRILQTMREDEQHHATTALDAGGAPLPLPVRGLMRLVSKIMTKTTYWV
jgi:ubiquinone biosynthesis monooxygenase Coq7